MEIREREKRKRRGENKQKKKIYVSNFKCSNRASNSKQYIMYILYSRAQLSSSSSASHSHHIHIERTRRKATQSMFFLFFLVIINQNQNSAISTHTLALSSVKLNSAQKYARFSLRSSFHFSLRIRDKFDSSEEFQKLLLRSQHIYTVCGVSSS